MHSPHVTFITNQEMNSQQPSQHKILKNSLKLTLKSASKSKISSNHTSRCIPQISCRLSQSGVNNDKYSSRQSVKKEIDTRLVKAYSSIVRHKSIQLTGNKSKKLQLSSSPFPPLYSPEDLRQDSKINCTYEQLPYELVRKYVQNIYEQYSIQDPLSNLLITHQESQHTVTSLEKPSFQNSIHQQTPEKSYRTFHEQNKISTKKKILLLKNHFIDELNTEKKVPLKLEFQKKTVTQTSEIKSIQEITVRNHKNMNATTHKKKLSFAFKEKIQPHEIQQKNTNDLLQETKFSASSVNNLNFSSVNPANDSYWQSRVYHPRNQAQNREISEQKINQIFRYCFVCEDSILEANILHHEKTCQGLREILNRQNMPKEEFLLLMDKKIEKIQNEVHQILNQIQIKQTSETLDSLKNKVLEWIGIIDKQSSLNKSSEFKKTFEAEKNIDSLIDSTKLLKTVELIKKLKWFVHLKRNFLRKMETTKM